MNPGHAIAEHKVVRVKSPSEGFGLLLLGLVLAAVVLWVSLRNAHRKAA